MSTVRAQSTADLVDRRAVLLKDRRHGDSGGAADLDQTTAELRERLSEPSITRVLDPVGDAALLSSLADREPVHSVTDDADLADRTDSDRRVFALFNPALADRPTNVVWVALWSGSPNSIQEILDPSAPTTNDSDWDTAVFYSIWNAEPGLAGLGGGPDLLDAAVEYLAMATALTLSPIPGLRRWMQSGSGEATSAPSSQQATSRECASYLTSFRKGRLSDPVARFHMGNGARLLRVLPDADTSRNGQDRSFGFMANYRYSPEDHEANRQELALGTPAIGADVERLLA